MNKWLGEVDATQWDCHFCQDKQLQEARNCGLPDYEPPEREEGFRPLTQIRVIDEVFTECPISAVDLEASQVVSIVNMCEGEFGGRVLPNALLEESKLYHNLRSIVLSEGNRIDKLLDEKRKRNKK